MPSIANPCSCCQPLENGRRLAVEDIKICKVDRYFTKIIATHSDRDLFQKHCVFEKHVALDTQSDPTVGIVNSLGDVRRHRRDYESAAHSVSRTAKLYDLFTSNWLRGRRPRAFLVVRNTPAKTSNAAIINPKSIFSPRKITASTKPMSG